MVARTTRFCWLAVLFWLVVAPSFAFRPQLRLPQRGPLVGPPVPTQHERARNAVRTRTYRQPQRLQLSLDDNWEEIANRIASQERSLIEQWSSLAQKTTQNLQWNPTFSKAWFAAWQTAATDVWNFYAHELPWYTELAIASVPVIALAAIALYRWSHPDPDYRTGREPYPRGQYDPIAAQAYYARNFHLVLQRSLELLRLSNQFLFQLIVVDKYLLPQRAESQRPRRAQELLRLVQTLGPTAIKVGQALSVRPDLIPSEYAAALRSLQDAVPPFDSARAKQLMREELGAEKFAELELDAQSSKRPVARCVCL